MPVVRAGRDLIVALLSNGFLFSYTFLPLYNAISVICYQLCDDDVAVM